ncbi:hypothetical protein B296_00037615 [Ensete ventricosum]|uniref:Uncharacterized protein n=1 Tax=Ensete ventricosum TaxID=4639 RepID=A0A426ZW07_ENSVE|nr:hypothetical protein B296_00037615 [Ensete ventricosum]
MRCGGARSPFPLIWRKISVHVELRGVVDGHNRLKSNPSTLLFKGPEPHLELSLASSFDFVTSFYTSSSCLFTRRSYARSESVESDDNVSGSYGAGSTPRYGSCLGSRWRDCDLRDGHDSRSRWVWLFVFPVGEETGKMILRHDPPSSAKCWGLTVMGVVGWTTLRIRSAMPPATRYQGHCRLVGQSCPLCHVASRPLSKAR